MKILRLSCLQYGAALAGLLVVSNTRAAEPAEPPPLIIRRSGNSLELSWPATFQRIDNTLARPYFELQQSTDLQHWEPIGERQRASSARPGEWLRMTVGADRGQAFYRILSVEPRAITKLGLGGEEVFGYGTAFAEELARIGQISPDQFAALFPNSAQYLPGISWDPTIAQFWLEFNADPNLVNRGKSPEHPDYRTFDYRLNERELTLLKKNGFVVSERLGSGSFADVFYNIWKNDLPVFISTDAILQAWHRTYDAMLEEMEETYLFGSVQRMLDGMASQISATALHASPESLRDSLLDADYFLAVARTLLAGEQVRSVLNQDARVAETLADIKAEELKRVPSFLGFCRMVDFSQFKVRGHYTHSERLL